MRVQARRELILGCLLVLLLGCVGSTATLALSGPAGPAGQVENELRRTDTLLDRARDEVAGVRNAFSHERLRKATEVQRDAWTEFRRPAPNVRRVVQLTHQARELALKAIEAAGIERRAQENVRAVIDRAEERMAEIGAQVRGSGQPLAARLLEQGGQQLRRAGRAWRENDPRAARLATLALSLIERAGRIAAGQGSIAAAAEVSIERADALLAEVETRLQEASPEPDLVDRLREARALLDRAREALRQGWERPALRLSLQGRELGLKLLSRLQQQPSAEDLLPALEDLEVLYDELAVEIGAGGNPEARAHLAQGRTQLEKARRLVEAGEVQEAVVTLTAAETLLRDAAEAAGLR